jgi:signal transduction histidine kinase
MSTALFTPPNWTPPNWTPAAADGDDLVERLTDATSELARRNAALEDFATLVAHELKTPLHAALVADDPVGQVRQALELVDSLLEGARSETDGPSLASAAVVLDQVIADLAPRGLRVVAEMPDSFPLPAGALRVILRNLVRNAIAAGARTIHVSAAQCAGRWTLAVDDDGVGLGHADDYRSGSGVGLGLSRRIAGRHGAELDLVPLEGGGTRARVQLAVAA